LKASLVLHPVTYFEITVTSGHAAHFLKLVARMPRQTLWVASCAVASVCHSHVDLNRANDATSLNFVRELDLLGWVHGCVLAQHPHSNVDSRVLINTTPRPPDRPALNNHGWEGESMEGTWRVARRTRDGLGVATARRSRYRHSGLGDGEWAAQQVSVGTRLLVCCCRCLHSLICFPSLPRHGTNTTHILSSRAYRDRCGSCSMATRIPMQSTRWAAHRSQR